MPNTMISLESPFPSRPIANFRFPKRPWSKFITPENKKYVSEEALGFLDGLLRYDHQVPLD